VLDKPYPNISARTTDENPKLKTLKPWTKKKTQPVPSSRDSFVGLRPPN